MSGLRTGTRKCGQNLRSQNGDKSRHKYEIEHQLSTGRVRSDLANMQGDIRRGKNEEWHKRMMETMTTEVDRVDTNPKPYKQDNEQDLAFLVWRHKEKSHHPHRNKINVVKVDGDVIEKRSTHIKYGVGCLGICHWSVREVYREWTL